MEFVAKGVSGYLKVTPTKVILEHTGFLNALNGKKGVKEIPIKNITSIQFKKPGFTNGYIEFTFSGGKETKGKGTFGAVENENAMVFTSKHLKDFIKAKELIEQYRAELEAAPTKEQNATASVAEQIRELAKLRDEGILSDDEFEAAKKKLLGIPV